MIKRTFHFPFLAGAFALTLLAAACTPAWPPAPPPAQATATPSATIQGVTWQWTSVTDQATQQTTMIPAPADYTITFNADGTLNGKADCNTFTGSYETTNGLVISLGATTMAFCGEGSLDQQYLSLLSRVVAGGPDGAGGLALETPGGAQRMLFADGGAAGTPEP